MALEPHSQSREAAEPSDYEHDHPDEDPRQWGWHGEWGKSARGAGVVVGLILLVMLTSTNYQSEYRITLIIGAIIAIGIVILDRIRRKNSWRR